jgi:hypothetical protein
VAWRRGFCVEGVVGGSDSGVVVPGLEVGSRSTPTLASLSKS